MTDTTPIPLKATEVKTWIAAHPDADPTLRARTPAKSRPPSCRLSA